MAKYLKGRGGKAAGQAPSSLSMVSEVAADLEALVEFLGESSWPDGAEREPGTVLICTGEGRWRVWLNDKGSGTAAWTSGSTLEEALFSAEKGLREDTLEWRQQKEKGPKRTR